jgi:hypothetical protein
LRVIEELTRKTDRDKQRNIGPSELGNPCPKCVGRALVNERPEQDFSLYPWIGTAVHYFMEHNTFTEEEHELRLYVGEIEGYGSIKGTTDMWYSAEKAVTDWKIVGLKKIKSYRVNGVPTQYRYQAMLYGLGCELAGYKPEKIAIVFIPRDSGNVKDIWVHEEEYQPEMAQKALERGKFLFDYVTENGWESLESDDNCFQCNMIW